MPPVGVAGHIARTCLADGLLIHSKHAQTSASFSHPTVKNGLLYIYIYFFLTLSENISGHFKGTRVDRFSVWMYFGGASIFLCEKADILLSDR